MAWDSLAIELIGAFLGVFAAFKAEDRRKKRDINKRINIIIPFIYMELAENYYYINDNQKRNNYVLNYWDVFKDELKIWEEDVFIKIIRVYNYFSHMEYSGRDKFKDQMVFRDITQSILEWFDEKANTDVEFRKSLETVNADFKKVQDLIDESEKEAASIQWKQSSYRPKYFTPRSDYATPPKPEE